MSIDYLDKTVDKLLPIEVVEEILSIKKSKIFQMIKDGEFPQPVKIGRSSRWKNSEIQEWIRSLKAAS